LRATREWFLPRAKEFVLKHTHTRVAGDASLYTTLGVVVPVKTVLQCVPGATRIKIDRNSDAT
jgi:hypothetical protein